MERQFDLVVIGTGAAGSAAAYKCRKAGWDVAITDSRPFGGTCALRGCDPKKVLVGAATLIDWVRRMDGKGIPQRRRTNRVVRIDAIQANIHRPGSGTARGQFHQSRNRSLSQRH